MAVIGNFFLILATLSFFVLQSPSFRKPMPGGDAGVGYAWGIILFNLAFFVCMIIVGLCIGAKGGFEWVSPKRSNRVLIVTVALLSILITCVLSSFFKSERGPSPAVLQALGSFAPVVIPIILILASAILLNTSLRSAVPVSVYKWPLIIVTLIGLTGTASALVSWVMRSVQNQVAVSNARQGQMDSNHLRMLQEIDTCVVMKNMVFILVFTGDNQHPEIRSRSVAKVKTHPQWQQELIRLLQTDWAPEPLQFLASNDVEDPSLFTEPVRIAVLTQARLIRQAIQESSHPSHFYPERFGWEVERALRTVDRFKNQGIDYRPAVQELRAALDEPSNHEKPKFRCISILDRWLKENR